MPHKRRHLFAAVSFVILLVFLLTEFRIAVVHGDSMLPTYKNGQMVLVNRLPGGRVSHGDVVLVKANDEVLIKRVYRLPGETLSLRDAYRFRHATEYFEPTHRSEAPLRVPDGRMVVLGDNSAVSDDSRSFGPIALSDVIGKVLNAPPPPQPILTRE